jgi:hypothetical protein
MSAWAFMPLTDLFTCLRKGEEDSTGIPLLYARRES